MNAFLIKTFLLLAFFIILPLIFNQTASAITSKPNIVVIMADDLDNITFGRLYSKNYLPNIKKYLGDGGIVFTNTFVTTSLCCPSRATFFTGQYSHNHGVLDVDAPDGGVAKFNDISTLPTWLKVNGYGTGLVGKYLNQYGSMATASATSALNPTYVPPGWDFWRALPEPNSMYNYKINANGTLISYGSRPQDYQTDVLSNLSTSFINGITRYSPNTPFFLEITPYAPHYEDSYRQSGCNNPLWSFSIRPAPKYLNTLAGFSVYQKPNFNEADMSDKPTFLQNYPLLTSNDILCNNRAYQARSEATRSIDDLVGNVINSLIANNILDKTIIIFTSDNGFFYGDHRIYGKVLGYEEGIRVPLMIRVPGYAAGQTITQTVLSNDFAPTIADFAGITPNLPVDGRSIKPLLDNPNLIDWRKRFLVEFQGQFDTSQVTFEVPATPRFLEVRTTELGVTPKRKYILWEDGSKEFYDLNTDPYELQSKHNDSSVQTQIQQLDLILGTLKNCGNGSCQTLEDQ
jgi:N-acetylglucosamine-6-sulfatase